MTISIATEAYYILFEISVHLILRTFNIDGIPEM